MKHITILALHHATLTSIDGAFQLLSRVNDFLVYQGKKPFYKIEIVGIHQTAKLNNGLYNIKVHQQLKNVKKTNLIIVPITCGDFGETIKINKPFTSWLIDQYNKGAEIASFCVGAFFLASTGLLDNKECSTHWAISDQFKKHYPKVKIVDEKIVTYDKGIYTSGGNYSFLNLLLYIIEKDLGKEVSILASKMFEIEIDRKAQNEFFIFQGQKQHGDDAIKTIQDFIENNFSEDVNVNSLTKKFGIGRRTLERKFKKLTGNSVFEYLQRVRVEAAKHQLELSTKTINEIVYEVGYLDVDAFRNVFRKYVGMSLGDYANKYR
ncbi:MAG TPA: helix-turn-helix domain-containing protein [Flavipsychrobacter sp.]|nr:helix-turn-helix domain-containing protein [Flavipsychrobacter sp.]